MYSEEAKSWERDSVVSKFLILFPNKYIYQGWCLIVRIFLRIIATVSVHYSSHSDYTVKCRNGNKL
jgi:hypothetical protein